METSISIICIYNQWKAIAKIDNERAKRTSITFELYDLSRDPLERENVAEIHTDILQLLTKMILKHVLLEGHIRIGRIISSAAMRRDNADISYIIKK